MGAPWASALCLAMLMPVLSLGAKFEAAGLARARRLQRRNNPDKEKSPGLLHVDMNSGDSEISPVGSSKDRVGASKDKARPSVRETNSLVDPEEARPPPPNLFKAVDAANEVIKRVEAAFRPNTNFHFRELAIRDLRTWTSHHLTFLPASQADKKREIVDAALVTLKAAGKAACEVATQSEPVPDQIQEAYSRFVSNVAHAQLGIMRTYCNELVRNNGLTEVEAERRQAFEQTISSLHDCLGEAEFVSPWVSESKRSLEAAFVDRLDDAIALGHESQGQDFDIRIQRPKQAFVWELCTKADIITQYDDDGFEVVEGAARRDQWRNEYQIEGWDALASRWPIPPRLRATAEEAEEEGEEERDWRNRGSADFLDMEDPERSSTQGSRLSRTSRTWRFPSWGRRSALPKERSASSRSPPINIEYALPDDRAWEDRSIEEEPADIDGIDWSWLEPLQWLLLPDEDRAAIHALADEEHGQSSADRGDDHRSP